MKSLTVLWKKLAEESANRCCTSATMDIKTVQGRSKHEGFSFYTITLPEFGKDFQTSLDQGLVSRHAFPSFSRKGGLPRFLGGFLESVFDRDSGVLLDDPSIDSIIAVRQLTLLFSKILLPCSDARIKKSIDGYIQCEQEVKSADSLRSSQEIDDFKRVSALLFSSAFSKMDNDIYHGRAVPKHGPGATADKLRGNSKFRLRTWTDRLEKIFPAGEFLSPSWSHYWEQIDDFHHLEPGSEIPVRVITVPKTLKTPRIIAVEPSAMQYAQQAVLEVILTGLERDDILSSVIGFEDQTINNRMALEGSLHGDLATLDLSEASDRVSNQLVRALLHRWPNLSQAVDATRSRKADVPGHSVIRLAKYASMGSATCFPMEAMVFTTLIFLGIEQELGTPLCPKVVKQLKDRVRVYGDDIIIPVQFVHSVVHVLETFGFRVNAAKSFWIGKFRESCGREYYNGHDVSIVKVRRVFPSHRKHVQEVISIVELRNQFYQHGYWSTCEWLDNYIRKVIKYFPCVLPTSPVLGRHSFLGYVAEREHETLHSPLVKGYVVNSRIPLDQLDGPGALLKYFLKRGSQPYADRKHLERAGRPHAVNIKLRWASPF